MSAIPIEHVAKQFSVFFYVESCNILRIIFRFNFSVYRIRFFIRKRGKMTALQQLLFEYRNAAQSEREKGTDFEELIITYLRNEPQYADFVQQCVDVCRRGKGTRQGCAGCGH